MLINYLIQKENLSNSNILKRTYYILLFIGLAIGVLFDILFYKKTSGISYPIFIASLLVVFFISMRISRVQLNNRAWVLAVPILVLSATLCIYSNIVLRNLNLDRKSVV